MSRGWIGVDLDGTLAHYDGWKGDTHIGAPVPAMVDRVVEWLKAGREVRIFTARVSGSDPYQNHAIREAIWKWLAALGLPALPVTCVKDYAMVELFDDRCVPVERNTGRLLAASQNGV